MTAVLSRRMCRSWLFISQPIQQSLLSILY